MASDGEDKAPLTEPVTIQCIFVSGVDIVLSGPIARFVGWAEMPAIGGETEERRIVVRFVMSRDAARTFCTELRNALKRKGH
jgi:mono/diheme cytochrome c family protein